MLEAMRFALQRIQRLTGIEVGYYIFDCIDSSPPMVLPGYPFVSGLYSWQAIRYLQYQHQLVATPLPFMNVESWGTEGNFNLSKSAFMDSNDLNSGGQQGKIAIKKMIDILRANFYATVPPEQMEIKAIVDILIKLNLTYISVVGSNDLETQNTVETFVDWSLQRDVCLFIKVWISKSPSEPECRKILDDLRKDKRANVVILFTSYRETMCLMKSGIYARRLTFISGSKSRLQTKVRELRSLNDVTKGLLILQQADTYDEEFASYFMSLKLATNSYTWFKEFWRHVFNCSLSASYITSRVWNDNMTDSKECTGNETLTTDHIDLKYFLVKPVLNAIESLACALWNSFNCQKTNCLRRAYIYTTPIQRELFNNFRTPNCSLSNAVKFNDNGYYERNLVILNFNGSQYNEVGYWNYSRELRLFALAVKDIAWKNDTIPKSSCYQSCDKDEIKDRGCDSSACCYVCRKCNRNYFIENNMCIKCPDYHVPTDDRRMCRMLPRRFMDSENLYTAVLLAGTLAGIFLNTAIVAFGIRNKESRVVKAASRELSLIMVISLYLCFASSSLFLLQPTRFVCGALSLATSTSLNAFYAPLLLKIVRLYRIFSQSKKSVKKPALVSPKSQVLLSLLLVSVFLIYDVILLILKKPSVKFKMNADTSYVTVACQLRPTFVILTFLPNLIFMMACTYYGYKIRNFPSNFNESFSIRITLYVSCFLWAIFVPLLFLFEYKQRNAFTVTFLVASIFVLFGIVQLVGIFFPLVWKVIVHRQSANQITPSSSQFNTVVRSAVDTIHQAMKNDIVQDNRVSHRDVGTDPIAFADISIEN
eukprot:gene15364-6596_t